MIPIKTKKMQKTPGVFFAFIVLSIVFAWTQYIVPLEHISTEDRLQASKNSFAQRQRPEVTNTADGKSHDKLVDRPDYHVVFSTSCTDQQNWESCMYCAKSFSRVRIVFFFFVVVG